MPAVERAPYYLDNFERLLDRVVARYGDLLTARELAFAGDLRALSLPARCLYVRLVSRVGPCFRRDELRYDEIPEPGRAVEELAASGLLDVAPGDRAGDVLPHLRRAEIAAVASDLGVALPRGPKAACITALERGCPPSALLAALRRRVPLVAPRRLEQVDLFRLLFFGNLRQDWTELLLADLGVRRYESYPLDRELRLFPTRDAIEQALAVRALAARATESLLRDDAVGAFAVAAEVARSVPSWHLSSRTRADRLLIGTAQALERLGRAEEALELYVAAESPPARERRARLLARSGRERAALALCLEIAAAPRDETERRFAPAFEQRLRRAIGQLPPVRRRYRRERRLVLDAEPGVGVERLVLAHFAREGRPGLHSENWLWRAVYGLVCWDIVFQPVPGAFAHEFQDAPLDLHDAGFRARREQAIEQRLAEIVAGDWPAPRVIGVWHAKRGIRNRLVPWGEDVPAAVELVLGRLGGAGLAAVLDRLSRDLARYGRGLPDLFVTGPDERAFELYEVKSPADRLRPEQIGWLDHLAAHGVPATVLAVAWSARPRARAVERADPAERGPA